MLCAALSIQPWFCRVISLNLCIQLLKTLILNFKDTHRFFAHCEGLRKFSYIVVNDNRAENLVFIKNFAYFRFCCECRFVVYSHYLLQIQKCLPTDGLQPCVFSNGNRIGKRNVRCKQTITEDGYGDFVTTEKERSELVPGGAEELRFVRFLLFFLQVLLHSFFLLPDLFQVTTHLIQRQL